MKNTSIGTLLFISFGLVTELALAGGGGDGGFPSRPSKNPTTTVQPNLSQPPLELDKTKDQKIISCDGDYRVNIYSLADSAEGVFGVNINTMINNGTGPTPRGKGFDARGFVGQDGSTYLELNDNPSYRILLQRIPGLGLRGEVSAFLGFGGGVSIRSAPIKCVLLEN